MRTKLGPILTVLGTLFVALIAPPALAAYITVHGGPTWSPGPGGVAVSGIDVTGVNDAGTVVGSAYKYDGSGASLGLRAVRWDGSGAPAVELGDLGTDVGGFTQSHAEAINNAGAVVGTARLYLTDAFNNGDRAVRWSSSGTAATLLGKLGPPTNIAFYSIAFDVNDAGDAVGAAYKVLGQGGSFSDYKGARAVRWNASSTTVTELGHLGTDSSGLTYATAYAINSAGAVVGNANKYTGSGVFLGPRAVRWNPGGIAATELGHLGTDVAGFTICDADAVNDAGIAVGAATKYDASGRDLGVRAVRWDASGAAATELGNLGTDSSGSTSTSASAINSAGAAIGSASKFDPSGKDLGQRAVRWDASGKAATELGNLPGFTHTQTEDINDAGAAVGWVEKYESGVLLAAKAVYWGFDALPVDLNTLIDPASGWTLNHANRISDTGWIGGRGTFDPDGPGGQEPYERLFVMHVPAAAVPEPATVILFGVALAAMLGSLSQRSIARRTGRRTNRRQAVCRPCIEPLEDRCLLSFSSGWPSPPEDPDAHVVWAPPPPLVADFTSDGILDKISSNYHEVIVRPGRGDGTFGDPIRTSIQPTPGAPLLAVADFNGDSRPDVFTAGAIDFESPPKVNVLLGRGDGGFVFAESFSVETVPTMIGTGEIFGAGRTDVAIAGYNYLSGEQELLHLFNDGHWWTPPSPALPGDFNGDDVIDGDDLAQWQGDFGLNGDSDADDDGDSDGFDFLAWQRNLGQPPPTGGAGSDVAAAPVANAERPLTTSAPTKATDSTTLNVKLGNAVRPASSHSPVARHRDLALAVLDSQLPTFIPRGPADLRRLHAPPITEFGMKARGSDLPHVWSAAAKFDLQPSEGGRVSRSINDSAGQDAATHRESLDIVFTALEHAE